MCPGAFLVCGAVHLVCPRSVQSGVETESDRSSVRRAHLSLPLPAARASTQEISASHPSVKRARPLHSPLVPFHRERRWRQELEFSKQLFHRCERR
ncbi:hypothetical protein AAFF_G00312920 [Aldrovandia affinis]|uniref:Uncharacterized protein n=1 Tax=Aldrovandia affinis TaxID=143900 RepID=A0AAD7WR05_9TELE|nr:hypothetical protein AAFF_G00312920 [Aldrovandia affinis]